MSRFHKLEVTNVHHDTRDAVVITLQPSAADRDAFAFTQGQYLTFKKIFDGEELRRSYSICSGLDDSELRVAIKCVEGGAFSTWANTSVKPGDVLETMPPMGNFHQPLNPASDQHYLCVAAGSGITPIISIIKTILTREPHSTCTLLYSNRHVNAIMFREELEDLKNIHLGRLNVIHILTSNVQEIDLFTGRIDADKCRMLFENWIDPETIDAAFICGPEDMMLTVATALQDHGLRKEQIKFELFAASQPGRARLAQTTNEPINGKATINAAITLDGATRQIEVQKRNQCLLDAALASNLDAPYSCRAGVCSTCRAKVLDGEFEMAVNHALEDYEVQQGYVLTCQCYPLGDSITVTYDQ